MVVSKSGGLGCRTLWSHLVSESIQLVVSSLIPLPPSEPAPFISLRGAGLHFHPSFFCDQLYYCLYLASLPPLGWKLGSSSPGPF